MTKIRWTNETWNPTLGCDIVSPGCKNCYAMRSADRFQTTHADFAGLTKRVNGHPVWTGLVRLVESRLETPFRWKKPRRVFVDSMSDLFHPAVPFEFVDRVFTVMEACPQHTFQLLTKRPERLVSYMVRRAVQYAANLASAGVTVYDWQADGQWLWRRDHKHIWLGVSVEDQMRADERIPLLLSTPAHVKFLSCEPLIGRLTLRPWMPAGFVRWQCFGCRHFFAGDVQDFCPDCGREGYWSGSHPGNFSHNGQPISWVIVGGESAAKKYRREMHPDWARTLRDQCIAASVPFFYKQASGPRTEMEQLLDGERWEQYPGDLPAPFPEQVTA